jgi:phosphoribosylamine-glycine ligase
VGEGTSLPSARGRAYAHLESVAAPELYYRRDIAGRHEEETA